MAKKSENDFTEWRFNALLNKGTFKFPILGRIKAGYINEASTKLDIVVPGTFLFPEEFEDIAEEIYGPDIKVLPVRLFSRNVEDMVETKFKRYRQNKVLVCYSEDGKKAMCLNENEDMEEKDCLGITCEFFQKKHCDIVGTFRFVLEDMPGFGAWWIQTKSPVSIENIRGTLNMLCSGIFKLDPISIETITLTIGDRKANPKVGGKKTSKEVTEYKLNANIPMRQFLAMATGRAKQLEAPRSSIQITGKEAEDVMPDDLFPELSIPQPDTDFDNAAPEEDAPLDDSLVDGEEPEDLPTPEEVKVIKDRCNQVNKSLDKNQAREFRNDLSKATRSHGFDELTKDMFPAMEEVIKKYTKE